MKYSVETEINLPLARVVELFDNPANVKNWMPQLVFMELLSGEAGKVGAKTRMRFKNGGKDMEMTETVTVRNLPSEYAGTYEFKGGFYSVSNHFEELPGGRTRYISDQDFQMQGLMKYMGLLMPWAFKRESKKHMALFKSFAENGGMSGSPGHG